MPDSQKLPSNRQPPAYTVSMTNPEATLEVIKEAVLKLWDVVNALTSLQPPKRKRYRVTIFGSARIEANSPIYAGVRQLAAELTRMGCDIVTGGGPGLMAAANEGSVLADPENKLESIGIRIHLDSEQDTNPFVEEIFQHRTFFSRLHQFVLISDAFVVLPGGIGTALEAFMIWQLLQVRHLREKPLIMVGPMWADLVAWAAQYMVQGEAKLASAEDLEIPHCVNTIKEAIAILQDAQANWQNRQD